ncbi:MAG: phosphoenolpyruvate mutase [Promethearchaeota archaeon]
MKSKREVLRNYFQEKELIRIVGAHNGLSAKLVEKHGFDGVWASGLEVSTSYGVPDANILTMTEYLNAAQVMNEATNIPIIVDCDTGYGNSNNVIYMVKKFEAAGIAAVCIEDKLFPKVNSFIPGRQELAPISEFVGKIMAGKNAQKTEDFMIFARVEALIAGWGQEEALKRAKAYVEAGADAILIHSKSKDPDQIKTFVNRWNNYAPLIVVPTTYPSMTEDAMRKLGIKMVIYANHGIRAAIKSMNYVFDRIYNNGIVGIDSEIASMQEVFDLQDMYKMKEAEKKFLRNGKENIKVLIPAAGDHKLDNSMELLLQDIPLIYLDINGKRLIDVTVKRLNSLGLYDISVISGYKSDKVRPDGFKLFHNKNYRTSQVLESLMCARSEMDEKTIILFSDVIVDPLIIKHLTTMPHDITLVIDRAFFEDPQASQKGPKKLDLVITSDTPVIDQRVVDFYKETTILKIGKNINLKDAHCEFIGLSMFSKKGLEILKRIYDEMSQNPNKLFHEAINFNYASFTDIIQEIIDRGYTVNAVEIYKGWSELKTFEDYYRITKQLKSIL